MTKLTKKQERSVVDEHSIDLTMDCPGCGATYEDRERYEAENEVDETSFGAELAPCPHCGGMKCAMCNMGDDTLCLQCEGDEE